MHKPLVIIIVALLSIVLVPSAYAACSVTYTFANGTTADAIQVNQNFSDVIGCTASSAQTAYGIFQANLSVSDQSLTSGVWTKAALVPVIDTESGFSAVDNWYVIPKTGKYRISGIVLLVAGSTGGVSTGSVPAGAIGKNGTFTGGGTGLIVSVSSAQDLVQIAGWSSVIPSGVYQLTAGDTIELDANLTASVTPEIAFGSGGAPYTSLSIEWVGQ